MREFVVGFSLLLSSVGLAPLLAAEASEPPPETPSAMADSALRRGDFSAAIRAATQAIKTDPADFRGYFLRARAYDGLHAYPKSLADYTAALKANPKLPVAYQQRGAVHFRLGHFADSVADFDRFIEAVPGQAPQHWQRGISLYYAGRFEEGRKQFELHQTVNPSDVENAVWHFLCVARSQGLQKAKDALIPIAKDSRIPLMEVHRLFAGKATPDDVLAAAREGAPPRDELDQRLFYAHLYLGLYFEAIGNTLSAREHISKAATDFKADHYMGDVARVHASTLSAAGRHAAGP
jgi:lipoprotein NlpI